MGYLHKPLRLFNEKLLDEYKKMACVVCSKRYFVAGHHHVKRSRQRLDIEENLSPLCFDCHNLIHWSQHHFIRKYGQEKYDELTSLKCSMEEIIEKYGGER